MKKGAIYINVLSFFIDFEKEAVFGLRSYARD